MTRQERRVTSENDVVRSDPVPGDGSGVTIGVRGLTESQVIGRRLIGQGNNVEFESSRSFRDILRDNLFTFFNMVLFGLGLMLVLLGRPAEAVITSGVVLTNIIVAGVQEVRAKRKLDQIAVLTRPRVTVLREGREKTVDPSELVVGDVLIVSPGDQIVVDGEVLGEGQLGLDESLLTGESDLVPKKAGDPVYSGSFCVTGKGMYRARTVGMDSLANQLAIGARTYSREHTPLQREVDLIIRVLLGVVAFYGLLLLISAVLNETPLLESVQAASVLFGLAPSSLFLMIVVAYAVGALRIADKGALVQQANSVESLCRVTVLCLDKTGTLTSNRLRLRAIRLLGSSQAEAEVRRILGDFVRSLSAGNLTSEAIAESCEGKARPVAEEVPFSSAYKWSALSFDDAELQGTYVLGAPEVLQSSLVEGVSVESETAEWLARGFRVLLFASRSGGGDQSPLLGGGEQPQLPGELTPICLLCFHDELRPSAKETLAGFASLGIELKIISGDHPSTVAALATQAGLARNAPLKVVSGLELAELDSDRFRQMASEANIFGRITPQQKELLIRVLREQGHYVAMTGDGVNDVLALKKANLGIAMQGGSQATRNVADIVLLNDSFAVLPEAFREGQRILTGMRDILRLYLTRILSLATLVASIAIIGGGFPFTPKQNALISIFTLSIPSFALALWARRGPISQRSTIQQLAHFVLPAVITLNLAGLLIYLYFLLTTRNVFFAQQGLTLTMTLCGLLLIIFVEPPTKTWVGGDVLSKDRRPTLLAVGLFLVFALVLAVRPLRDFYDLNALPQIRDYLVITAVVLLWARVLRYVWRAKLLEKYLNLDLTEAG